jgi:hypothetical protein
MEASSYYRFRTMGPGSECAKHILHINVAAKYLFIESRLANIVRKIYNLQALNFSRPLRLDDLWFSWGSPCFHLTCCSSLSCDKDKGGFLRVEVFLSNFCSALVIDLGLRACYRDGVLYPPKPGQTADPKPCAGNDGTLLTVRTVLVIKNFTHGN